MTLHAREARIEWGLATSGWRNLVLVIQHRALRHLHFCEAGFEWRSAPAWFAAHSALPSCLCPERMDAQRHAGLSRDEATRRTWTRSNLQLRDFRRRRKAACESEEVAGEDGPALSVGVDLPRHDKARVQFKQTPLSIAVPRPGSVKFLLVVLLSPRRPKTLGRQRTKKAAGHARLSSVHEQEKRLARVRACACNARTLCLASPPETASRFPLIHRRVDVKGCRAKRQTAVAGRELRGHCVADNDSRLGRGRVLLVWLQIGRRAGVWCMRVRVSACCSL